MKTIGVRFLLDIMLTYVLLGLCFILAIQFDHYLSIIGLSVLHGLLLHRLGLFIHAAAHRDFSKNDKAFNDWIYSLTLGWFFGIDIESYRKKHWAHHKNHGTINADPEDTYSKGLRAEYFLGRFLSSSTDASEARPPFTLIRALAYLAHIALYLFFAWATQSFFKATLYYLLPVFFYLPLITHIRNCMEHTPIKKVGGAVTRSFRTSLLSFFLGAAGFQYHKEHHDDPSVEYWLLKPSNPQASYMQVLADLIRSSRA
jgi:fatty acid desaturase